MKKRFTIMLNEEVIQKIKKLNNYWTPSALREKIEKNLDYMATFNLGYEEMKKLQWGIPNIPREKKDE